NVELTPKEAKALEEKLKQLAKQMGEAGQGSLGDAVGELADALKGGNGKVGQAAKNVAKKINNAIKRRKSNDRGPAQTAELQAAKGPGGVVGGEPIPLGHRQTVKRYFELIRPSGADMTDKKPAEPEKK